MFGKKQESSDLFDLSIEAENLAMPEIHVRDHKSETAKIESGEKDKLYVFDAITTRCSVRKFKDKEIAEEDIKTILKAGMSGPSAVNSRDWSFVVVTDKEILEKMAAINGGAADPLKGAAMGILVCGDVEKAFEMAKEFWIIDGAIAAQNMILAAKGLGIGSVWLGTWPNEERVKNQSKLFDLPATQIPHSIIAFGYPDDNFEQTKELWDESVVHYNKW